MSDNGYMMLDEAEAYNIGFLDGSDDQYYTDRIAAFGAIRRAAAVARGCDSVARYSLTTEPYHEEMLQRAYAVRLAIRAAIGSPKA